METARLCIRPLGPGDRASFVRGIRDRELCRMYGFPEDPDEDTAGQIFEHFRALPRALALLRREDGKLVGFVLDLPSELPEETRAALPSNGRTFAYATFPAFQRRGYMLEALRPLLAEAFRGGAGYVHCGHFPFNQASESLLKKLGFAGCGRHGTGDRAIVDEILYPGTLNES